MAHNTSSGESKKAVAVGGMTLAAAAIGAFWLYGAKGAARNRKMASSWILKARAEVMDAVEKVKDIDKDAYLKIVDTVVNKYTKSQSNYHDVKAIASEMKAAWAYIAGLSKSSGKSGNSSKKAVKRVVKKFTK